MADQRAKRHIRQQHSSSVVFDTTIVFLACAIVASLFQRYAPDAYMVRHEPLI
jgi:hypothetical protein